MGHSGVAKTSISSSHVLPSALFSSNMLGRLTSRLLATRCSSCMRRDPSSISKSHQPLFQRRTRQSETARTPITATPCHQPSYFWNKVSTFRRRPSTYSRPAWKHSNSPTPSNESRRIQHVFSIIISEYCEHQDNTPSWLLTMP